MAAAEGMTTDGPAALRLDDILFEVFSRVGNVKDLFRCAVTCRRWRRLFTDPDFLHRLCPETDRARLLGLFFHGSAPKTNTGQFFVPRLESPPLGSGDCGLPLASSVPHDDHGHRGSNDPLASRHGILLRHIVVNRGSCCIRRKPDIHYRLLDPVTGALDDVAPPLKCTCVNHANGYAILTAADGDHINREQRSVSALHPAFSGELLLVGSHLDGNRLRQHVHSYSGATHRWSAPAQIRHRNRLRLVGARAAVVHRGAAHWLYADDTIDATVPQGRRNLYLVSASTAAATGRRVSASVTKLAIKAAGGVPYLCVHRDGSRLSLARVHPTRVDVWTQQDGDVGRDVVSWLRAQFDGKEWLLAQVIQMPAAVPAGANFMCCSWFHFSKGAMVAVYGGSGVFVLDLETKGMEKIMDLTWCDPSRGYYSCLPYEMDTPEFFLRRLGWSTGNGDGEAGGDC